MVDPTRYDPVGADAFWRKPQQRTRDAQIAIDQLRNSWGKAGFTFSTQSLVIKGDGQIVGEGTGTLDWNGPASFGGTTDIGGNVTISGDTDVTGSMDIGSTLTTSGNTNLGGDVTISGDTDITGSTEISNDLTVSGDTDITGNLDISGNTSITGTLNLQSGIIGDDALASLVRSETISNERYNYAPGTSWTNLLSVTVDPPSWATSVSIVAIGTVNWHIAFDAVVTFGYIRLNVAGSLSPPVFIQGGSNGASGATTWANTVSGSSNRTVTLMGHQQSSGMFDADPDANAGLAVQVLYLR